MVYFIIKLYFGFYYTMIDNMFFVIKIMGFGTLWENCKFKYIIFILFEIIIFFNNFMLERVLNFLKFNLLNFINLTHVLVIFI